jgi:hypothetical protein
MPTDWLEKNLNELKNTIKMEEFKREIKLNIPTSELTDFMSVIQSFSSYMAGEYAKPKEERMLFLLACDGTQNATVLIGNQKDLALSLLESASVNKEVNNTLAVICHLLHKEEMRAEKENDKSNKSSIKDFFDTLDSLIGGKKK